MELQEVAEGWVVGVREVVVQGAGGWEAVAQAVEELVVG